MSHLRSSARLRAKWRSPGGVRAVLSTARGLQGRQVGEYLSPMDTKRTLKLIEGDFSASEAAQVLLSLVRSKIDFHTLAKISNVERFGRDIANSERRLAELKQLQETVRSICQSAAEAGQRLQVKGWIEIALVPAPGARSDGASAT
jgi:hypothetical protein